MSLPGASLDIDEATSSMAPSALFEQAVAAVDQLDRAAAARQSTPSPAASRRRARLISLARVAMDRGVRIDAAQPLDQTLFTHACHLQKLTLAKIFLELGADIARRDRRGYDALAWACLHPAGMRLIAFLIEQGAPLDGLYPGQPGGIPKHPGVGLSELILGRKDAYGNSAELAAMIDKATLDQAGMDARIEAGQAARRL